MADVYDIQIDLEEHNLPTSVSKTGEKIGICV